MIEAQEPQTTVPDERDALTVDNIRDEIERRIHVYRGIDRRKEGHYPDRVEALVALRSWIERAER